MKDWYFSPVKVLRHPEHRNCSPTPQWLGGGPQGQDYSFLPFLTSSHCSTVHMQVTQHFPNRILHIFPTQDSISGPDSGPADYLLHHLHPGLCSAQSTAEERGEKRRPRSSGQRRDGAGGTQEGGVCGFQFRTITTNLRQQHRQGDTTVTVSEEVSLLVSFTHSRTHNTHTYLHTHGVYRVIPYTCTHKWDLQGNHTRYLIISFKA